MALRADRSSWMMGGGVAVAGHAVVLAGVLLLGSKMPREIVEEPVVLIELPPLAAPAPAAHTQLPTVQPEPETPQPDTFKPRVEAPQVRAPLPQQLVAAAPSSPPLPRARSAPPVSQPVTPVQPPRNASAITQVDSGTGTAATPGDDPKAKREEADYYALLSAHLNRKKHYPSDARKARQQGVVTVRFTVRADGSITASSIRKSSGHALLDQATLDLMQRVAPLPKFPKSMTQDSVTISLPIDYSLRTR
jgi:protein TonB